MLPFRIIFDIYIIKLRMGRDGSRLAAVCLGRWKFVGPRRSSLHSVRFGQLLVTLCTSTHCQCNESVHRKEQLLFTPFMTVSDHFEDSQYMDPAHTSLMPHAISIDFM